MEKLEGDEADRGGNRIPGTTGVHPRNLYRSLNARAVAALKGLRIQSRDGTVYHTL